MNKIEKFKQKAVEKYNTLSEKAQMKSIIFALKGMNQQQLEHCISLCLANNKSDEKENVKEIMFTIKQIYIKRGYKWIYD